jgi:hypothetical protein
MATPYAEGVLATGDLLPHLASQVALERPEPEPRDFPTSQPFWAALDGALTIFVVNEWRVVEGPLATAEANASVGVDGGEATQADAAAEERDVGAA